MKDRTIIGVFIILLIAVAFMNMGSDVDINMLRGCTDTQVAKWDATAGIWDCANDNAGGGSAVTFDIGDDGGDDSTDINEIATTGDTNSIFTESSSDKVLIAVGNKWPASNTADALAANGANCSAGQAPLGVDAAGAVEGCFAVAATTSFDTEAELEALLTDVSDIYTNNDGDPIYETELDAEAELESQLADVTNVFTNNDTIDISSNTNLAVTAPVVLTDDTLSLNQNGGTDITADLEEDAHCAEHDGRSTTCATEVLNADAELYTDTKCIWFEDPTAADDFKSMWTTVLACTITGISCESDQTVNFDLQIDDGTPTGVNGSDIACTSTWAEDTSLGGDTSMGANEHMDLAITSVSGTPTWVSICWEFTYDD